MITLYWLIPLGLILLSAAIWFLFWAIDSDQFDDLDHAGQQILMDDQDDD